MLLFLLKGLFFQIWLIDSLTHDSFDALILYTLQDVLYRPYVLSIQVVCLEIIRSNPQGVYLHIFPIWEFSTKLAKHFDFLSIKPQPFLFILPCLLVLACFFGQRRCFRCCVNFFMIWWLLSTKERVQWALHLLPFRHTLAHVLFHQRKIDSDPRNQKLPSLIPQRILFHTKPRLLFRRRMPRAFCLFVYEIFAFGNSLFVSRL